MFNTPKLFDEETFYECRHCSKDSENLMYVSVLVMDKMDMSLTRTSEKSYSMSRQGWEMAFRLLEKGDFSKSNQSGWFCCDDLKPDNILLNVGKKYTEASGVVLIDWDPEHWHYLPLHPGHGQFLNSLMLCINTVLCHAHNKQWLKTTLNCWPESNLNMLQAFAHLSGIEDVQVLKFVTFFFNMFNQGPFHYAGVRCTPKRMRSHEFLKIFHNLCKTCITLDESPSLEMLEALKERLRRLRVDQRREVLIRSSHSTTEL